MNPESFFRRRIVAPILAQLRQGVAPERIALALAVGAVVGIFPILGVSTALCAGLGVWLRLNQPVIQLVNYLMYPLQLALLIPFCRAGERAFGAVPLPMANVPELVARFHAGAWQFFVDYGRVILYGSAVWCVVALPLVALTYLLLKPALLGLARRKAIARQGNVRG